MRYGKTIVVTLVLAAAAAVPLARWWMRPPAVAEQNLRYLPLLRTAISSRNVDWLRGVERAVEQQGQAGKLGEVERRHFSKIIAVAREGDWERADRMAYGFEQAQSGRVERSGAEHAACCSP